MYGDLTIRRIRRIRPLCHPLSNIVVVIVVVTKRRQQPTSFLGGDGVFLCVSLYVR